MWIVYLECALIITPVILPQITVTRLLFHATFDLPHNLIIHSTIVQWLVTFQLFFNTWNFHTMLTCFEIMVFHHTIDHQHFNCCDFYICPLWLTVWSTQRSVWIHPSLLHICFKPQSLKLQFDCYAFNCFVVVQLKWIPICCFCIACLHLEVLKLISWMVQPDYFFYGTH
jgi:hypothetical protein